MKPLRRSPLVAWPGLRGGEAAPGAGDVALSGELALALRLGATACQVDEAEFVRRAIAEKAGRLGLPALAGALHESGEAGVAVCAPRLGSPLATRGSDESVAFNSDGDLIAVPDFRRGCNRFAERVGVG